MASAFRAANATADQVDLDAALLYLPNDPRPRGNVTLGQEPTNGETLPIDLGAAAGPFLPADNAPELAP